MAATGVAKMQNFNKIFCQSYEKNQLVVGLEKYTFCEDVCYKNTKKAEIPEMLKTWPAKRPRLYLIWMQFEVVYKIDLDTLPSTKVDNLSTKIDRTGLGSQGRDVWGGMV